MQSATWDHYVPRDDGEDPAINDPNAEPAIASMVLNYRSRSVLPDPLSILIAAESGHPVLIPLFPVDGTFPPGGDCPHKGRIKKGSPFVCMYCHQSGQDHRKFMELDAANDPKPDPKEAKREAPKPKPQAKLTRAQRRALVFQPQPQPE